MNQAIQKLSEPFPHLIVENMYNQEELELIWEELNFLTKPQNFLKEDLATASKDGVALSNSKSILIDNIYTDRATSNILTINRKLFDEVYLKLFSEISPVSKSIFQQNFDLTKIRYYEDDEEYSPHIDDYNYTSITFFHKNPKVFEGGDLYFPDYDYYFKCINNNMILFPSCIPHSAIKVKMYDNLFCSGNGRYSMMQFLKII